MAVAFIIRPGGSKEQLDAVVRSLGIDDASQMAEGQIVHVEAYDAEGNPIVLDVWESEQHFNDFAQTRLMAALQSQGVEMTGGPPPAMSVERLWLRP